ncbi:MAG: hypothetical protein RLZZ324_911 [Candidatus Parcubacteria bacterium]|jgi:hypothetical protein
MKKTELMFGVIAAVLSLAAEVRGMPWLQIPASLSFLVALGCYLRRRRRSTLKS